MASHAKESIVDSFPRDYSAASTDEQGNVAGLDAGV
jgi:hypothetical protein